MTKTLKTLSAVWDFVYRQTPHFKKGNYAYWSAQIAYVNSPEQRERRNRKRKDMMAR